MKRGYMATEQGIQERIEKAKGEGLVPGDFDNDPEKSSMVYYILKALDSGSLEKAEAQNQINEILA